MTIVENMLNEMVDELSRDSSNCIFESNHDTKKERRSKISMSNDVLQKIFDTIEPVLPEDWKKMILFIGYTAGSYTMKYYTSDNTGKYTDCFSLEGVNRSQLTKVFMGINKILKTERDKLDEKNKWSVMTMIVSSDGKMRAEFDYSDISENAIAYERKWKEKYQIFVR